MCIVEQGRCHAYILGLKVYTGYNGHLPCKKSSSLLLIGLNVDTVFPLIFSTNCTLFPTILAEMVCRGGVCPSPVILIFNNSP